ncbi:MAG: NnrU family protein [Granulosicoccus sp.]
MLLLMLGLLLWSAVHFIPSLAQPLNARWLNMIGDVYYKISFSLIIILSIVMMVFGWRSTTPAVLYELPEITRPIAIILMALALSLQVATNKATRINQLVRHPMLSSVIVWSVAHLLVNGDSRSLVLFGGLGIWAILETFAINRREGVWQKPDIPGWSAEIKFIAISFFVIAWIAYMHNSILFQIPFSTRIQLVF